MLFARIKIYKAYNLHDRGDDDAAMREADEAEMMLSLALVSATRIWLKFIVQKQISSYRQGKTAQTLANVSCIIWINAFIFVRKRLSIKA